METPKPPHTASEMTLISKSVAIKGEVSCDEDLMANQPPREFPASRISRCDPARVGQTRFGSLSLRIPPLSATLEFPCIPHSPSGRVFARSHVWRSGAVS